MSGTGFVGLLATAMQTAAAAKKQFPSPLMGTFWKASKPQDCWPSVTWHCSWQALLKTALAVSFTLLPRICCMRGHSAVVCKFTPQMSQHTLGGSLLGAHALRVCLCLLFARPVARSAFIDTSHAAASTEQQVAASASWTILGTVHAGCQSLCHPNTKTSAATKILCSVECLFSVGVDVFCLHFCGTFPFVATN